MHKKSNEVTGRQTGRRGKRKTQVKDDGSYRNGLEDCGSKGMESKNFGQNRMGICREGSQGQT